MLRDPENNNSTGRASGSVRFQVEEPGGHLGGMGGVEEVTVGGGWEKPAQSFHERFHLHVSMLRLPF